MAAFTADRMPIDPGPAAWNCILPEWVNLPSLESSITADWLVIGGGFAGLSAAKRLRELHPKDRIILLEARRIAEGPAGRNSGFMIDLPHNLTSQDYAGALEKDRRQIEMNRSAIQAARKWADEFSMPEAAITASGKTNAAATGKGVQHNLNYAKHLDMLGETYQILNAQEMKSLCGSTYYLNGLYTPGTAMLQPALYVRELANGIIRQGVTIFEQSPVIKLTKSGTSWQATAPNGKVEAAKVILAVNGHAESFGFYKKRLMHVYLYASMTERIGKENEKRLGGEKTWAFTPADPMGSTVRKIIGESGTRLIIRNSMTWSPNRAVDTKILESIARTHDRTFTARFPELKSLKMEYHWGGLLCLSRNNVSAFGEIEEGLYSACCQNGLGSAKGTLNGILSAEQASGVNSPYLDQMLAEPLPRRLVPEPFLSVGAKSYTRFMEFRAGREL